MAAWKVPKPDSGNPSKSVPIASGKLRKKPVSGMEAGRPNQFWCFSFKYWKQIDKFGLGGMDSMWFVSLLERLREISKESIDVIQGDKNKQDSLRYHGIDWKQYNIPIQRAHLNWLPQDILENDAEYPIYQFSISTGRGRIAGFWGENKVFHIILIDPYHNLQPSKRFDYKVTTTSLMPSEHEWMVARLALIKKGPANCGLGDCSTQKALEFINLHKDPFGILYVEGEYFDKAKELIASGKAKSVEYLLEMGILQVDNT